MTKNGFQPCLQVLTLLYTLSQIVLTQSNERASAEHIHSICKLPHTGTQTCIPEMHLDTQKLQREMFP